jgi:hypothetical protein
MSSVVGAGDCSWLRPPPTSLPAPTWFCLCSAASHAHLTTHMLPHESEYLNLCPAQGHPHPSGSNAYLPR